MTFEITGVIWNFKASFFFTSSLFKIGKNTYGYGVSFYLKKETFELNESDYFV